MLQLSKALQKSIIIFSIFLFGFSACNRPEPKEEITPNIMLTRSVVDYKAGNQFIDIETSGAWTLELYFEEGVNTWARVNTSSGNGSKYGVVLSWDLNSSEKERKCDIVLKTKTAELNVKLSQTGVSSKPTPGTGSKHDHTGIQTSVPAQWLELPATDREDLYFITHDMTTSGGQKTRNFSYYYDADAMLALWVAYPLNKALMAGSAGRTEAWGFDPKVPIDYQQELHKGYKGGYDRGHQIPSADRQTSASNCQTFYFTNMTPQKGELNQQQWASLEGRVRDWAGSCDTLYVVTGADFANSKSYAKDNNGQDIPVPTGYFKTLLAYKKSTQKYYGIAFYYEHRKYNNDIMDQAMTIDKLEEKLGIDFFVNLPAVAGQAAADNAESTIDNWWKK